MSNQLLERENELKLLENTLISTLNGNGNTVLISGEAGIGKTSLIDHFTHRYPDVRVLRGNCDPLLISHPFCPLHDIARQIPETKLGKMVWEGHQVEILYYFLEIIEQQPTIVIIEDIHWSDEATLDLLSFLVRRIRHLQCLLLITYRDDEISLDHPLTSILGHFTGNHVHRIPLKPLSRDTVLKWVEQEGYPTAGFYEATGGNPFYITETLTSRTSDVPQSVSEIVLSRFSKLSTEARKVIEMAAIIPKERFDLFLLREMTEVSDQVLETVIKSSMLCIEGDLIGFRHDIARRAVLESLSPIRSKMLNTIILHTLVALCERSVRISYTQIVHHAKMAGDSSVMLEFAPRAAVEAHQLGAHRESAAFYVIALEQRHQLELEEQAHLLEKLAYEYYLTAQIERAIDHYHQALTIWQKLKNLVREGDLERWLSRLNWFLGERAQAEYHAERAIQLLENGPPSREQAMAYSNRAQLHMLARENEQAIALGQRAVTLARQLEDYEVLAHALNNIGTAQWTSSDSDKAGYENLKTSLNIALEHGMHEHVARAYTNITSRAVHYRMYDIAEAYLKEGIEYAQDRDLESWSHYMRGWRVRQYISQGRWAEADTEIQEILDLYQGTAVAIKMPVMLARIMLCVRRGDSVAQKFIDEIQEAINTSREIQRIGYLAAAQAELAWYSGDKARLIEVSKDGLALALQYDDQWMIGDIGIWLWRTNALTEIPQSLPEPYDLQMQGNWKASAALWHELGCPFEEAMTLADGDVPAQQRALTMLENLGAYPAADWLREKLQLKDIITPRIARPAANANPAGLTTRQMQVLRLLVAGYTDTEIAEELFISPKTAGHHVSAILNKLDVRTRQEAAVKAVQNSWF